MCSKTEVLEKKEKVQVMKNLLQLKKQQPESSGNKPNFPNLKPKL